MADRTVFVAGGTSGINLGIARRFAELGARIAVLGRDLVKAKSAAESIGPGAIGLSADVRDYDMVHASMEQAVSELGPKHLFAITPQQSTFRFRPGR
ncbi:SDR family NAD(P)-dependent oxidoreductase [Nocardia sp. NPDC052278]|uniref:SDR family NAD(P)-dependent oxidoreductase n=1 Tax=unclassified Nocardia TaxID=2637762 RepID=UPI0036D07EA3